MKKIDIFIPNFNIMTRPIYLSKMFTRSDSER